MSKKSPAKSGASDGDNSAAPTSAETEAETRSGSGIGSEAEADTGSKIEAGEWTLLSEEPVAVGPLAQDNGGADVDELIVGADDTMPPVPDEIREAGRLAPDHWLGMVDPTWNGEGTPPEWAMVGRWRSGLDGEIAEWQDNEEYQPSPRALGWPEPADDVDAAVQLAATGYGPGDDVVKALVDHEVAVHVQPGGGPLSATTPDGTSVVPVFTSPVYLHAAGRLAYELHAVPDLLGKIPEGHLLYLNPSGPVSMTVELDAIREEIEGGSESGSDQTSAETDGEPELRVPPLARPVTTVSVDGSESSDAHQDDVSQDDAPPIDASQGNEREGATSAGEAPGDQPG
ncbi:type VII secretion system-associated protein [Streptomyces sp. NPDC087901]|uniref:type VII secretion system-associated protein n=1 Tax=Streptomyces sp. NPDC087901 TaxID=3365818 RepID=UPI003821F835